MSVPLEFPPAYLCLPAPGERTMPSIIQKVRTLALRRLLSHPLTAIPSHSRGALLDLRRLLGKLAVQQKALVLEAVGQPDVLTRVLVAELGPEASGQDPGEQIAEALPSLMAYLGHAATRGIITESIVLERDLSEFVDPTGHRHLRFDPPARGMLLDPMGIEFNLRDETKLRIPPSGLPADLPASVTSVTSFYKVHDQLPRVEFSLHDSNPLSMFELHPDKEGNAVSLGERPVELWLSRFHEALELIRIGLPEWFEESKITMRRMIPVGYLPERHLSAAYREAPSVAYYTLCEEPLTIAEAIVHETQHTKLNLLSWIDPIVHNGQTCWTKSPVRPDVRPLWGVLLAVHAFVPVAAMHAQWAALDHPVTHTERFPRRRYEVLTADAYGLRTLLDNAEASVLGRKLIDEMRDLFEVAYNFAPPPPPGMDIDPEILPC